jgi:hypothetical protein
MKMKIKMKKQNQGNKWGLIPFIIAVCLSLPFLAACSSEESVQNGTENAGNTYTFKVSEASNEDSITTRSAMKPQTVTRDLGNGMMLVGTLTDVSSSAATRATTTTPIADGTTITAYVCKSDGIITNVQNITLSGTSLTVHCPSGSNTIYFLIGLYQVHMHRSSLLPQVAVHLPHSPSPILPTVARPTPIVVPATRLPSAALLLRVTNITSM